MSISLESVDQVRERTGASYKDAKEALEFTEGSVLDAIVYLESHQAKTFSDSINEMGNEVIDTLKEIVEKGHVTRIIVEKDEKLILDIPVVAGALSALLFTPATIAAILGTLVSGCELKVIKEGGEVINVKEMTDETIKTVIDKVDELKVRIIKEEKSEVKDDESCECACDEEEVRANYDCDCDCEESATESCGDDEMEVIIEDKEDQ